MTVNCGLKFLPFFKNTAIHVAVNATPIQGENKKFKTVNNFRNHS